MQREKDFLLGKIRFECSWLSKQTACLCDLTSNKQHQFEVMDHIFICSSSLPTLGEDPRWKKSKHVHMSTIVESFTFSSTMMMSI